MRLKQLGANMSLLEFNDGVEVLFSYETPVAGRLGTGQLFKTEEKFSNTTSKHISKYLRDKGHNPALVQSTPQAGIDLMLELRDVTQRGQEQGSV